MKRVFVRVGALLLLLDAAMAISIYTMPTSSFERWIALLPCGASLLLIVALSLPSGVQRQLSDVFWRRYVRVPILLGLSFGISYLTVMSVASLADEARITVVKIVADISMSATAAMGDVGTLLQLLVLSFMAGYIVLMVPRVIFRTWNMNRPGGHIPGSP